MVACWTPLLTGKKHGREKHGGNTKQAKRNAKTKEQSNWHAIINQRNNIHFQSSINHVYSSWYWTAISGWFVYSPFHTATLHTDNEIVCHKLEVTIIFTEMRWSVEKAGQMAEAPSLACSASYQVALPEQYQPPFHMTNYQVCALGCWWKMVLMVGGRVEQLLPTQNTLPVNGHFKNDILILVRWERVAITNDYSASS